MSICSDLSDLCKFYGAGNDAISGKQVATPKHHAL